MTELIVLTGLVAVEKGTLAIEIAEHFVAQGDSVTVIDNIARLPIDVPDGIISLRVEDDISDEVPYLLERVTTDVVVLAVSERVFPEQLFVTLDTLQTKFDTIDVQTLALIDTRTCDCFPQVREQLEMYADTVVMLPYELDEVLNHVRNA